VSSQDFLCESSLKISKTYTEENRSTTEGHREKNTIYLKKTLTLVIFLGFIGINLNSQDITLPEPDKTGGKPLMQALNERQTSRPFTKDYLTMQ